VSEFLTEFFEGGQKKGGSIDAADWADAEARLARQHPEAVVVGRAARIEDAPAATRSVAAILTAAASDWLYDPDFNGWDVKQ